MISSHRRSQTVMVGSMLSITVLLAGPAIAATRNGPPAHSGAVEHHRATVHRRRSELIARADRPAAVMWRMAGPRTLWRLARAAAPPALPAPPVPPAGQTASAPAPPPAPAANTISTPATSPAGQAPSGSPAPLGIPGNWTQVANWQFTGNSLPADWRTGWFGSGVTAGVGGTSENDCYTPSNVTFPGDGTMHLNITATASTCDGQTKPYSAAMVTTNPSDGRTGPGFTYTYGVLEAKVYIPAYGNGTQIADWPAVWTDGQSWPTDGEDDIFEGLSGSACFHFHDPLGAFGGCDTSITPGWHTFASDWQPGSVTYYYDGVEVGRVATGVTSAPMYIIISNGVGYSTTPLTQPDSMQVAYVRVWQQG